MRPWIVVTAVCLGMVAGGLQLTRIATRDESAAVAGWVRTDGELSELKVWYLASLKFPSYRAEARYSYEVDGQRYTGNGMLGATSASTFVALKRQLRPWMTDPAARVSENPDAIAEVLKYEPMRQVVPVYYDPRDPAVSAFGEPSMSTREWTGPMWWFGASFASLGGAVLVILALGWRSDRQRERERRAREARAAAGRTPPSPDHEREFVGVIDGAIAAIEAMRDDPRYGQLRHALDALVTMRTRPSSTLLHQDRTGFGRWLSGELDVDNWGPAGARVADAVRKVDSFHNRWRANPVTDRSATS